MSRKLFNYLVRDPQYRCFTLSDDHVFRCQLCNCDVIATKKSKLLQHIKTGKHSFQYLNEKVELMQKEIKELRYETSLFHKSLSQTQTSKASDLISSSSIQQSLLIPINQNQDWKQKLKYKYANSKRTRDNYSSQINSFNNWLNNKNISEDSATQFNAENYLLEEIIDKRLSKSKLELSVAALNFRFGEVENKFTLKAAKYRGGENRRPHFAYSHEQLSQIFEKLPPKLSIAARLQYEIAGRLQDLAFFDSKQIIRQHSKVENAWIVELPPLKTSAKRTVFISKELKDQLPKGRLFPDIFNTHTLEKRFNDAFKKHLQNFDERGNIHTHNFRVSKATHMSEQKVPLQQIMHYLGHKKLNTTQKYLKDIVIDDTVVEQMIKGNGNGNGDGGIKKQRNSKQDGAFFLKKFQTDGSKKKVKDLNFEDKPSKESVQLRSETIEQINKGKQRTLTDMVLEKKARKY